MKMWVEGVSVLSLMFQSATSNYDHYICSHSTWHNLFISQNKRPFKFSSSFMCFIFYFSSCVVAVILWTCVNLNVVETWGYVCFCMHANKRQHIQLFIYGYNMQREYYVQMMLLPLHMTSTSSQHHRKLHLLV